MRLDIRCWPSTRMTCSLPLRVSVIVAPSGVRAWPSVSHGFIASRASRRYCRTAARAPAWPRSTAHGPTPWPGGLNAVGTTTSVPLETLCWCTCFDRTPCGTVAPMDAARRLRPHTRRVPEVPAAGQELRAPAARGRAARRRPAAVDSPAPRRAPGERGDRRRAAISGSSGRATCARVPSRGTSSAARRWPKASRRTSPRGCAARCRCASTGLSAPARAAVAPRHARPRARPSISPALLPMRRLNRSMRLALSAFADHAVTLRGPPRQPPAAPPDRAARVPPGRHLFGRRRRGDVGLDRSAEPGDPCRHQPRQRRRRREPELLRDAAGARVAPPARGGSAARATSRASTCRCSRRRSRAIGWRPSSPSRPATTRWATASPTTTRRASSRLPSATTSRSSRATRLAISCSPARAHVH